MHAQQRIVPDGGAPDAPGSLPGSADDFSASASFGGGAMPQISAWERARRSVRAPHWWYFTPLPLASLVGDAGGEAAQVVRCLGGMLVTALCLAYAYGLNGIADRGMDQNAAKNSLVGLDGVPREAAALVAACALGALGIAAGLSPLALLGATVSLVAGTLYSSLLRLKRFPFVGTVVNVLIFAPLPLLAVSGAPSPEVLFLTYCFWVLVTQNQILHEVSDADEDETAGVRTTGVMVGTAGVGVIAFVLGPIAALTLWWMQAGPIAHLLAVVGLCGGAVFVAMCDRNRARQLRFRHRVYCLAVGGVLFTVLALGGGA